MVSKGEQTKNAIIDHAVEQASMFGLEGLSIGTLAGAMGMSKSGLFAHFRSKENLQVAVVERARERFEHEVVRPALAAQRGEPRVRALFDLWIAWATRTGPEGGCVFVTAAAEFDDRPGDVRDAVARGQRDWLRVLAGAARRASEEGHFRDDLDPELFAFRAYGAMLASHLYFRLLESDRALEHARSALDLLIHEARR